MIAGCLVRVHICILDIIMAMKEEEGGQEEVDDDGRGSLAQPPTRTTRST